MEQGIVLVAIGDNYRRFAVNLATSIRNHCNLPIHLFADELHFDYSHLFDKICLIDKADYLHNGKFSPGLIKLQLNKLSLFDKSIYIDVDSIVLKDLTPLFDKVPFYSQVTSVITKKDTNWSCYWTSKESVDTYFLDGLKDYCLPEINSSILVFDKSDKSNKIFADGLDIALNCDYSKVNLWGGTFPDELGFNLSLAINKANLPLTDLIYTRIKGDKTKSGSNTTADSEKFIKDNYYTLTVYGSYHFNHPSIVMDNCRRGLYYRLGGDVPYKLNQLMRKKHVNNK